MCFFPNIGVRLRTEEQGVVRSRFHRRTNLRPPGWFLFLLSEAQPKNATVTPPPPKKNGNDFHLARAISINVGRSSNGRCRYILQ
jgi:hypothetical protein